jgi:hypothetical protein
VVVGAAAVGSALAAPGRDSQALSPSTVSRYLKNVVPDEAVEVRVNGIYGSGHDGAWQFVAHLTWRSTDGSLSGGTTELPVLAGADPLDSPVDPSRIPTEHEVGWSVNQVRDVLIRSGVGDDPLAMVELEITAARDSLIACRASQADERAPCTEADRSGHFVRRFTDTLSDDPLAGPLSVHRSGAISTG